MSIHYYNADEDFSINDSINKYEYLLLKYMNKIPSLPEALEEMFMSEGATNDECIDLIETINLQINNHLNNKFKEIKEKYPKIGIEDARIISSYTCEFENENDSKKYNVYRILNRNLVSKDRKKGIQNVSKYLFIFLKSLSKLNKYIPDSNHKYLYRCIDVQVSLNYDIFDKTKIPYINGITKTFWGFTSTSTNIKLVYNFLGKKENIKVGTIFTLFGDLWGYDITLFNVFEEEEILLELERKIEIEECKPPVNEIINIRGEIKKTPIIFKNICKINEITIQYKIDKNEKEIRIFGFYFVKRYKNICKIISDEKEQELQEYFNIENINKEILEIKLIGILQITNMEGIFSHCESLISLPDISRWDTSSITNMSDIFLHCESLISLPDISKWDTSSVTNISNMFACCKSLKTLPDILLWNTSSVTDMHGIFCYCESLITLPDISKWNTSSVTNMSEMFENCESLKNLPDISKWDTSKVTNMMQMFHKCKSIKFLPDISKWNTSLVNNMSYMFSNCKSLKYLPDISKWNISSVTDINSMFSHCISLKSLPDISKWNISSVNIMFEVFSNCNMLNSLPDISKWNMSSVININGMFSYCESLTTLPDISKWNISSDIKKKYIVEGCKNTLNPDKFKK